MPTFDDLDAAADLHARNSDPSTSHRAMAAFDPEKMRAAVDLVVHLHRTHGPMADHTLDALFTRAWGRSCDDSLHRQARNQARNQGRIRDTGMEELNPHTKRWQIVWEACAIPPPHIPLCPTCGAVLRGKNQISRILDADFDA